jgi:hypothetical protein
MIGKNDGQRMNSSERVGADVEARTTTITITTTSTYDDSRGWPLTRCISLHCSSAVRAERVTHVAFRGSSRGGFLALVSRDWLNEATLRR